MEKEKEKEHFQFRISQVSALALILSIIATTIGLIDFIGLSPFLTEMDRRLTRVETEGADVGLIESVVANAMVKETAALKQAQLLKDLESLIKDAAVLEKVKEAITAAAAAPPAAAPVAK